MLVVNSVSLTGRWQPHNVGSIMDKILKVKCLLFR